jgi:hypothetical protein
MPTDNFESWNLPGFQEYEANRRAGKQRTFGDSKKSEHYGKPIVDPETGAINATRGMPLTEHTDKYGNTPEKF